MKTNELPDSIFPDFEAFLNSYVTEHKRSLFKKILADRTRYLTVVLENLFQPHNASAVLRSCDCFGIQDVHIIENKQEFEITRGITMGAHKWLDLEYYNKEDANNTELCFNGLRNKGYKIAATSPHKEDFSISELPLNQKTALVFGTEKDGLSEYALENADYHVRIPMYGFSESFNISVSAALVLYELTKRLRESDLPWNLNENEQYLTYIEWMRRSLKYKESLENHFFTQHNLQV